MNNLLLNLQILQAGNPINPDFLLTFGMIGLIFVVFYFLLIRPQQKKQKALKKMIESLKKGDKVVTIGGIRGTLINVKEQTVVVKVDENTKIEFTKNAVSELADSNAASTEVKK